MSILTKIAIVVMVVLVLIATAIFVNLTTQSTNWKTAYQREKEHRQAAVQTAREKAMALAKNLQANELEDAGQNQTISSLRSERNSLQSQLNEVQKNLAAAQADASQCKTRVAELTAAVQGEINTREKLATTLENTVEDLESKVVQNNRLQAQLAKMQTDVEGLTQMNKNRLADIRDLRETIARQNEMIKDLRAGRGVATAGADGSQAPAGAEKVLGEITAIQDGVASIDIGKANGVDKGMRLIVYRGGSFVGYLNISNVTTNQAAGLITLSEMDPQIGDSVTNRLAR